MGAACEEMEDQIILLKQIIERQAKELTGRKTRMKNVFVLFFTDKDSMLCSVGGICQDVLQENCDLKNDMEGTISHPECVFCGFSYSNRYGTGVFEVSGGGTMK